MVSHACKRAVRPFCRDGNRCVKGYFSVDCNQYVEVVFPFDVGEGVAVGNGLFSRFLHRYGEDGRQVFGAYRIIEAELYIVCRFRDEVVGVDRYPSVGVFPQRIAGLHVRYPQRFARNLKLLSAFDFFTVERLYFVFNRHRVFLSGFKTFLRLKGKVTRAVPAEYTLYGGADR